MRPRLSTKCSSTGLAEYRLKAQASVNLAVVPRMPQKRRLQIERSFPTYGRRIQCTDTQRRSRKRESEQQERKRKNSRFSSSHRWAVVVVPTGLSTFVALATKVRKTINNHNDPMKKGDGSYPVFFLGWRKALGQAPSKSILTWNTKCGRRTLLIFFRRSTTSNRRNSSILIMICADV